MRFQRSAMTLIEILVSLSIFMALGAMLTGTLIDLENSARRTRNMVQLHHRAQNVLALVRTDLDQYVSRGAMRITNEQVVFLGGHGQSLLQQKILQNMDYEDGYFTDIAWISYDWSGLSSGEPVRRGISPPHRGIYDRYENHGLTDIGFNTDYGRARLYCAGMVHPQIFYDNFEPYTLPAGQAPDPLAHGNSGSLNPSLLLPNGNNAQYTYTLWWSAPGAGNDTARLRAFIKPNVMNLKYMERLDDDLSAMNFHYYGVGNPNLVDPTGFSPASNMDRLRLMGPTADGRDFTAPFFPSRMAPLGRDVFFFRLQFFKQNGDLIVNNNTNNKCVIGRDSTSAWSANEDERPRQAVCKVVLAVLDEDLDDSYRTDLLAQHDITNPLFDPQDLVDDLRNDGQLALLVQATHNLQ